MAGEVPGVDQMPGGSRIYIERLEAQDGAPIGKANADVVRAATSYAIGGVPPIGFPAPLQTFIDRDLLEFETVWAAAGTPRHVFAITPSDLVRVTAGRVDELKASSA